MLSFPTSSRLARSITAFTLWAFIAGDLHAAVVTMKTGMQFEGKVAEIGSLNDNPLNPKPGDGTKPILLIDNGLTRTLVREIEAANVADGPPTPNEKIRIRQQIAEAGQKIGIVGPIIRVTKFSEFGHRIFSMQGPKGQLDIIQAITEITPRYVRLQGHRQTGFVWDMRIATSSVPRDILSKVIRKHIDNKNPDDRLRVVRLYIQAERYSDALMELDEAIRDFPGLKHLNEQADRLRQLLAQTLLREIELRRDAGQHNRVYSLLDNFPNKGIAGVTLLSVRDMLNEYQKREQQYQQILEQLAELIKQIPDEPTRADLEPIHLEIQKELSVHTLIRMADFLRLADDKSLKPDQKVSLAISGWLLGSGAAIDNLAVATSLVEVRDEVVKYLRATRPHERADSLEKMLTLEGGSPENVAKLIANMKPPITSDQDLVAVPDVPDLYEITVKGIEQQAEFSYYVQLPPEYNPYRRYPCVVTLNGAGSSPIQQLDWWAGGLKPENGQRYGQASRRGYIVIAPKWQKPHQREYEFSLREHAAVLFSLRDAIQRVSIDTDRVFLSGHSIGGDAVWDIAFSHPDLWAGVVPIVANSARYIHKYSDNGRPLPMYFVGGERDGGWLNNNGMEFDRYLRSAKYDVTIVQFLGRGHEHFQDEVQHIFDWMDLSSHRRNFFPTKVEANTMRPWDNYFWWLEIDDIPAQALAIPAEGRERKVNPIVTVGEITPETNRISVKARSGSGTVWLSPEMVSFDREINVVIKGRKLRGDTTASIETILEDVRTRGDRQHPFWAKIDWPERR